MKHPLQIIVQRHKQGKAVGLYSVCSANPYVLEAAVLQAKENDSWLLVEATSNQVDQFGGYTGMRPLDFALMVRDMVKRHDFPQERLLLGGDHLGPNRWQNTNADEAMDKAKGQIKAYVQAGFTKIHLDASMPLKGDKMEKGRALAANIVAQRSAELCQVAEAQAAENLKPVYVIGTDVPIPGGAVGNLEDIRITPTEEVEEILNATQKAFYEKGLYEAWERTLAVVVQPGVEFGDERIAEYQREKAASLKIFLEDNPQFIYEAHSTDYQRRESLRAMVEDHFAILKVGPALTFSFREAVFALSFMEEILAERHRALRPSNVRSVVDAMMVEHPEFWQKYYHGSEKEQAFARQFSFSDRIRYYWPRPKVKQALNRLIRNLNEFPPSLTLLSQFLPEQYRAVRNFEIENRPQALIFDHIRSVLKDYAYATGLLIPNKAMKELV